jgi:Spy/CpxP family protein refolding chaperone
LTADQEKQLAALEAETKAKLEKILTPEQMTQLKQMRPPRQGGNRGGGADNNGGPGNNNQGRPAPRPPQDQ